MTEVLRPSLYGAIHPITILPGSGKSEDIGEETEDVSYTPYKPAKLGFGRPHPDPVVENATLAARQFTEPGQKPMSDDDVKPFAGLAELLDKHKGSAKD